jgi:hypothetical protein
LIAACGAYETSQRFLETQFMQLQMPKIATMSKGEKHLGSERQSRVTNCAMKNGEIQIAIVQKYRLPSRRAVKTLPTFQSQHLSI